jgi:hypothetical protein
MKMILRVLLGLIAASCSTLGAVLSSVIVAGATRGDGLEVLSLLGFNLRSFPSKPFLFKYSLYLKE